MALFKNMSITYAGMALFAKAQAGQEIHFTKMQVGSGQIGTRNPGNLITLVEPKLDIPITSITPNPELKSATIVGNITNKGLKEDVYICELGLWAKDPDNGEILYGYANCGMYGDYYAPESQGAYSWQYQVGAAIGNAANVTASISELMWDYGITNSNSNLVYLKGANQKEINKIIDDSISKIKEDAKNLNQKIKEIDIPVKSVNSKKGDVILTIEDIKIGPNDKTNIKNSLDDIKTHSTYKLNKDPNGIYTEIQLRRIDGTLYMKSVLYGTSPKYNSRTVTEYALDGITVINDKKFMITYDDDDNMLSEVIQ